MNLQEIEIGLRKVLQAFQKDRTLLIGFKSSGIDNQDITVDNLACLAGNHLFDDNPEKFGITELEGHQIRAYFQTTFELHRIEQHKLLLNTFSEFEDKK